jgi:uncharacterized protein YegP (UPF0339 family)
MTAYEGVTYKAPSGQWSWKIRHQNIEVAGGAGYESEDEAIDAMDDELLACEEADRRHQVQQMVANFKLEGMEPSAEDQVLHQDYIAGRASLDDLKNHALAFALEQSALEHSPNNSSRAQEMLAAGHWVTYYDDNLVPDVILREWPDGRMEIVEPDEKGNVIVVKELPGKMELFKRRDALRAARANVQLSGSYPSKEAMDRMEEYATSKLTWDEFFNGRDAFPPA